MDRSDPETTNHKTLRNSQKTRNIKPNLGTETAVWNNSLANKVAWVAIWIACSSALFVFSLKTYLEYGDEKLVTVLTFEDQAETPDPVVIRICNNVYLDLRKVSTYNGSEFNFDSYEFLYQAAIGNTSFNDTFFAQPMHSRRFLFLTSSRILEAFKLDLDNFLLSCYLGGSFRSCLNDFRWHLEPEIGCYEANIGMKSYGKTFHVTLIFYLDPEIGMGKYASQPGVFLLFSHPDDHIGFMKERFIKPDDYYTISATTELKIQEKSYKKSKCFEGPNLQKFNFTGQEFEVSYNTDRCVLLCHAKEFFKKCDCSFYLTRNQTKTECLESYETRRCLVKELYAIETIEERSAKCTKECRRKCKQKSYRITPFEQFNKPKAEETVNALRKIAAFLPRNDTRLVRNLLGRLDEQNDWTMESITRNVASVTFYLELNQPEVVFETIPLMSFSTLLSNMGGLLGMWLGLSVISVAQFLETKLQQLLAWRNANKVEIHQNT